ncbi:MAG: DUF4843 domain-containing protein [Bacteroidales bacterium]
MTKINYILSFCLALMLASCTNDDYMLYDGEARLQFGPPTNYIYSTNYQLNDSLKSYTFVYEPVSKLQDTVFFDLYTMGKVSDTDRAFKLRQVTIPGAENAVAGVHFKSFDDATLQKHYIVKAGKAYVRVPVIVLRDVTLKSKIYALKLEVIENEFFKLGEKIKIWRKVNIADRLIRPNSWTSSVESYYWGKYSYVKHDWMVKQTGEKWDDTFIAPIMADYAEITFWKAKLAKMLSDYNKVPTNPGVPLTDEFGELVKF